MNSPSNHESSLEKRIIVLEEATMYNEQLLAKLNEVICEVQDRMDEQARQLQRLKQSFERQQDQEPEQRSFEDERPPHY